MKNFEENRKSYNVVFILAALLVPLLYQSAWAYFTQKDMSDYWNYTGCVSNLKNIGTAIEFYRMDHNKRCPQKLGDLTPGILTNLPRCPVTWTDTYSSSYRSSGNTYSIYCCGRNHVSLGIGTDCPKYDKVHGLTAASSSKIEEIKKYLNRK